MVSIKSLAILLFAAAVTAIPVAGGEHHDGHDGHNVKVHDNSKVCPEQNQEIYCCNDAQKSGDIGSKTSILDGLKVKCNNVPVNVLAVDVLSGASQCSGKAACCSSNNKQNGVANVDLGCIALAGLN
ncbi:unnamed protein product [Tuber aestivum]|uniref:Hydrophobin n=1 Tax=Tuber aestivum TaxID=59557 RepID=A0A292Q1W8_9PEZI|nr:unnamed protein product [Tuber aestivum]